MNIFFFNPLFFKPQEAYLVLTLALESASMVWGFFSQSQNLVIIVLRKVTLTLR